MKKNGKKTARHVRDTNINAGAVGRQMRKAGDKLPPLP